MSTRQLEVLCVFLYGVFVGMEVEQFFLWGDLGNRWCLVAAAFIVLAVIVHHYND